jgi:tetratricopeptide (TPR) repeat protein
VHLLDHVHADRTFCAVFWSEPPPGRYRIWVENNQDRTVGSPTPFIVRVVRGAEVEERSFADLKEYDEQDCFEFDLASIPDSVATPASEAGQNHQMDGAVRRQEEIAAAKQGLHLLRLDASCMQAAQRVLLRAEKQRDAVRQAELLRTQAEAQFASHDYARALTTFDSALAVLPGDILLLAFREKCLAARERWHNAESLLAEADTHYGAEDYEAMAEKVKAALAAFPEHPDAHKWQMRLQAWTVEEVHQQSIHQHTAVNLTDHTQVCAAIV